MKALKQSLIVLGLVVAASFNMSFTTSSSAETALLETTVDANSAIAGPGIYLGRWQSKKTGGGIAVMTCVKTADPWNCTGWQWW